MSQKEEEEDKNEPQYEELNIDNTFYKTEVPDFYKNRKAYKPDNEKELLAAIPGTIIEIFIEEGQIVEEGQDVLILEAMKMRNQIVSAIAGEVKSIIVKPGDIVSKNKLMVVFK